MDAATREAPGQTASGREAASAGDQPGDGGKRRQILEGARRVFLARGFDGASMGEIARAAHVSKGTLYVYFESKEALFAALTEEERAGLAEVLFQLDEHDPDIRGTLVRLARSFLEMMLRPEHISSVRMVIGAADKFPDFARSYYDAGPRWGAERLAGYLDWLVAEGRLSIPDTRLAAEQFLNLCSAGVLKRRLFAVETGGGGEAAERVLQSAVTVFMAAYEARPA